VGLAPTRTMVQTEAADEGESGSASGKEEASKEVKAMLVTVVSAAYAPIGRHSDLGCFLVCLSGRAYA